jgi:Glycoside hydrolase family 5 C-terminal domain
MANQDDGCHANSARTIPCRLYVRMLSLIIHIMINLLRSTIRLWNYNPANNDHQGDGWNGENFSWFSRGRALPPSLLYYEQGAPSLDNGARILPAIVRPYPTKTAGIPLRFEYELTTGTFTYEWANTKADSSDSVGPATSAAKIAGAPRSGHPQLTALETEIFVPSLITQGRKVVVQGLNSDDKFYHDESRQTLFIVARDVNPDKIHKITVSVSPPLTPAFELNGFWSEFGGRVALLVLALVIVGIIVIFAWA